MDRNPTKTLSTIQFLQVYPLFSNFLFLHVNGKLACYCLRVKNGQRACQRVKNGLQLWHIKFGTEGEKNGSNYLLKRKKITKWNLI